MDKKGRIKQSFEDEFYTLKKSKLLIAEIHAETNYGDKQYKLKDVKSVNDLLEKYNIEYKFENRV